MSAIEIRKVTDRKGLDAFILFHYDLYRGNEYDAPNLYSDEVHTLSKDKNAAFEFCEADYFLAYRDGKVVGRVAAIINHRANEAWNRKSVRFGWIDFVDDLEVSRALLDAVMEWGREKGMTEVVGPLGFTDMDPEGMLIEGFDQLGTMATIYNYPYYPQHMEKLGFAKEADWIEMQLFMPEDGQVPEKHKRISEMVMKRYNLRIKKYTSSKKIREEYGEAIFELVNEAFAPLYGYSALSSRQIKQYIDMYLPIVDLRMITLIIDENDRLVGAGLSMPSLSKALQKAKGKLFPFGWYHLAKVLYLHKYGDCLDLLLVAVKPEYQNKGVNALLFYDLIPAYAKIGFKYAESNVELETNDKVQAQWSYFDHKVHKRRRAFIKEIEN